MVQFLYQTNVMGMKILQSRFANRGLGIGAAVFVLGLLIPKTALAFDFKEMILEGIQHITFTAARIFGKLTAILFDLLVRVSNYNEFVDSTAVDIGWRIVRDISNIFFILVLLVIAFGTLFRIQRYHYTQLLRKLIVMAVLVNFSKLITGFFIDIMQVIMMTFVNAYADVAAGNLAYALGLHQLFTLDDAARPDVSSFEVTATLVLALAMISITFLAVLVYILMLVGRIVALWILTILSPLAYLFSTFPATQRYSAEWWDKFWKYASIGPMLAFSLWLTLTLAAASTAATIYQSGGVSESSSEPAFGGTEETVAFLSSVSSASSILGFILTIMLLIIGLTMAAGGATIGGAMAGRLAGNIQRFGVGTAGFAARAPFRVGRASALGKYGEGAAYGLAGIGSKIPGLRTASIRQRDRIEAARRERQKKHTEGLKGPVRTKEGYEGVRAMAGAPAWRRLLMGREGEARYKAAQKITPSILLKSGKDEDMKKFKELMSDQEVLKNVAANDWGEMYEQQGANLYNLIPAEGKRWLTQSSPRPVAEKAHVIVPDDDSHVAYRGRRYKYDREDDVIVPPWVSTGGAGPGAGGPGGGGGATPRADIDRKKFEETKRVIDAEFGGDANSFYGHSGYQLTPEQFLDQNLYRETAALRPGIEAALRPGEAVSAVAIPAMADTFRKAEIEKEIDRRFDPNVHTRREEAALQVANDALFQQSLDAEVESYQQMLQRQAERAPKAVTGINKTLRKGATGESMSLAFDFSELGQYGYALGDFQGANISGPDKAKAIQAIIAHARATGSVTDENTADFQRALESAESLRLINKSRVGGSARQVLRHEQAHDAVRDLTDNELSEMWGELSEERQREADTHIRSRWADGHAMSPRQVQEEFFTEAMASHGRSDQKGPLKLSDNRLERTREMVEKYGSYEAFENQTEMTRSSKDFLMSKQEYEDALKEEYLAKRLGQNVSLAKTERARLEVDAVSEDGIRSLWFAMKPNRQREIVSYLREMEGNPELSEVEARRMFFGEALAAHRGGDAQGPLAFTDEEKRLALLLHAATKPAAAAGRAAKGRVALETEEQKRVESSRRSSFIRPTDFGRTTVTPPFPVSDENEDLIQSMAADIKESVEGAAKKVAGLRPKRGAATSAQPAPETSEPTPIAPKPRPAKTPEQLMQESIDAYKLDLARKEAAEEVNKIKEADARRGGLRTKKQYDALINRTARLNLADQDKHARYAKAAEEHFPTTPQEREEQPVQPQPTQAAPSPTSTPPRPRPTIVPPAPTPRPVEPSRKPATRAGEPVKKKTVVEAPISPEIESKVIQNNTIQTMAGDILDRISRRVSELPTRDELKSQISSLQSAAAAEARRAGVAEEQIVSLQSALQKLQEQAEDIEGETDKRSAAQATIADSIRKLFKKEKPTETEDDYGQKAA